MTLGLGKGVKVRGGVKFVGQGRGGVKPRSGVKVVGQGRGGVKPRFGVKGGGRGQGRGQNWGRVRVKVKGGVMVGGSRGWSQGGSRV